MKRWWPVLLLATGCACAPTYHDETAYAPPAMEQQIELCATEGACTMLCARAFTLEVGTIDSCKIVDRDSSGGATLRVNYHEYLCAADYDDVDFGSGYDDDPCSDGSCDPPSDYDPCSDGSCDDPPDDDPPPDDPPDDPPPDDPPPDDPDPPM